MSTVDTSQRRRGFHLFKRRLPSQPNAPTTTNSSTLEKGPHDSPSGVVSRTATDGATDPKGSQSVAQAQPEDEGESGRTGVHPWKFLQICFRSSCTASKWTNVLWPWTIAAFVMHFAFPQNHLWVFITSYIGMVPAANLLGFAGGELAKKMPKVIGVVAETTFGSIVEIILFIVLITDGDHNVQVVRAAILGSILANLLLCLGLCFFVGGIFHPQQVFHEAYSEVGSNLMLVAGMGLVIPTVYYNSLSSRLSVEQLEIETLRISHATAILLLVAFAVYVFFQTRSHHGLYLDILEADEARDHDRHRDLKSLD